MAEQSSMYLPEIDCAFLKTVSANVLVCCTEEDLESKGSAAVAALTAQGPYDSVVRLPTSAQLEQQESAGDDDNSQAQPQQQLREMLEQQLAANKDTRKRVLVVVEDAHALKTIGQWRSFRDCILCGADVGVSTLSLCKRSLDIDAAMRRKMHYVLFGSRDFDGSTSAKKCERVHSRYCSPPFLSPPSTLQLCLEQATSDKSTFLCICNSFEQDTRSQQTAKLYRVPAAAGSWWPFSALLW